MILESVDLAEIENIQDSYTVPARQFATWCREHGHGLNIDAVRIYFRELAKRSDLAASTVCVRRSAVKRRVRQAMAAASPEQRTRVETALHDLDVGPDTRAPKIATRAVGMDKILSAVEYQTLMDGARSERQRKFMEYLNSNGSRISEMTGVCLADCTTENATTRIRVLGKGRKERYVRIPSGLFDDIRAVFSGRKWLFETATGRKYDRTYIGKQIRKLGRDLLGRTIGPNTFRHTFATEMIRKTGKIEAVSRYLGHSSVACTLQTYVHEQLDDSELFGEESQ